MQTQYEDTSKDFLLSIKKSETLKMPHLHYHNGYEIYFLISGERNYMIEDKVFKLFNNSVILIRPGLLHRTSGNSFHRIVLYFHKDTLLKYFTPQVTEHLIGCFKNYFINNSNNLSPKPSFVFEKMCNYYLAGNERMCILLLGELLELFNMYFELNPNSDNTDLTVHKIIPKVIKYINQNYETIENIAEIADEFFISKYYLCSIFKKNVGVSLVTYINSVKINAASTLLKSTDKSITEIATLCGFNSISYFTKTFNQHTHISPMSYRKNQQSEH